MRKSARPTRAASAAQHRAEAAHMCLPLAHGVRPSTVQLPLVGVRMPVISLTKVLLPAPFGPISPTSSRAQCGRIRP